MPISGISENLRISRTISSSFLSVMPFFRAQTDDDWMTGPSAIGSENGKPSSMTSAPAFSASRTARSVWRTSRDIDENPLFAGCLEFSHLFIQTRAHQSISSPRTFATICTSLSPRPESVTTTDSSGCVCGMSLSRYASACELSIAGMMPSTLERRWNASSASLSVTETYLTIPSSL